MLSKVVLSATFAATLVLTPAVLANNDVDLEVGGVALVDDGFVAEDAIAGRDLLGRKKHRSPQAYRKRKSARKTNPKPTPKHTVKPPIHPPVKTHGDEGDEGEEGDEGVCHEFSALATWI
jgi:hypothetical protein